MGRPAVQSLDAAPSAMAWARGAVPGSSAVLGAVSRSPCSVPAVGLGSDPAAPPPSLPPLVVALYERAHPEAAVLDAPQDPPNWRKLSRFHAHLWQEAVLDGSLVSLALTTVSGKFKEKKLPPKSTLKGLQ